MATALTLVHDALADFKPPLPRFIVELDDARRLLQRQRSPALEPPDRRYLLDTVSELQTASSRTETPRESAEALGSRGEGASQQRVDACP